NARDSRITRICPVGTSRLTSALAGAVVMRSLVRRCFSAAIAGLIAGEAAAASYQYLLTDLGVLPGDLSSAPLGMNNKDRVVAFAAAGGRGGERPFLGDAKGGMRDVSNPSGGSPSPSHAIAINDNGDIVGWLDEPTPPRHGFVFRSATLDWTNLHAV